VEIELWPGGCAVADTEDAVPHSEVAEVIRDAFTTRLTG
jgi:hypothetical protein